MSARLTPRIILEQVMRPRLKLLYHILGCEPGSLQVSGQSEVEAGLGVNFGAARLFFRTTIKMHGEDVVLAIGLSKECQSPITAAEWLRRPESCVFGCSCQATTLMEDWMDNQIADCLQAYPREALPTRVG